MCFYSLNSFGKDHNNSNISVILDRYNWSVEPEHNKSKDV